MACGKVAQPTSHNEQFRATRVTVPQAAAGPQGFTARGVVFQSTGL